MLQSSLIFGDRKANEHCSNIKFNSVLSNIYSEVPNRRADRNKRAGLEKKCHPACLLLSKSINEQGGIFRLLHEKLRAGWKENLKNLSEHSLLLGTLE